MKKLRESLSKKLKGNAGESIAEVLIALLIAALALTMLASVITTAAKTITKSKQQMDAYYTANEWLTVHSTSETKPWTVTVVKEVPGSDTGTPVNLTAAAGTITVKYSVNDVVAEKTEDGYEGIPVVAFWKAG